jgi:hypothetical protein
MRSFSRFSPFLLFFLVFFGGVFLIISLPRETDTMQGMVENTVIHMPEEQVEELLSPGYYALFSLNAHDWAHSEESIVVIERVLDLHETYGVPVDIYFTDPLFRYAVEFSPELIDRLKGSQVATVAYHIRPPVPYYPGFDWFSLSSFSEEELYRVLWEYESRALDLESGSSTQELGGYAYVKEVMGYAPPGVGILPGGKVGSVLGDVYADMGATFMTTHERSTTLGEAYGSTGLFYRPEDVDIKIYEYARQTQQGGGILEQYMGQEELISPYFLGIHYHDDNFYWTGGTPWWPVFFTSSESDKDDEVLTRRDPPFDPDAAGTVGRFQTEEENGQDWALYESTVRYVAEHPEQVMPMNLFMLREFVQ